MLGYSDDPAILPIDSSSLPIDSPILPINPLVLPSDPSILAAFDSTTTCLLTMHSSRLHLVQCTDDALLHLGCVTVWGFSFLTC